MAKRKQTKRSTASKTVTVKSTPIVVRAPSAPRKAPAKRRSSRRSGGFGGGDNFGRTVIACGLGGAAVGFIEKTFPNLPSLTFLGKKGTIAAAAYLLRRQLPYAKEVAISAAAISGYEFGKTGSISGADDDYWEPGVFGVAAQI